MKVILPDLIKRCLYLALLVPLMFAATGNVFGQEENFDSPSPVLITQNDSPRVLAASAWNWRGTLPRRSVEAFSVGENSRAVIFVGGIILPNDESSDAFRVYIETADHKIFRLKTDSIAPVNGYPGVYGLTVRIQEERDVEELPNIDGDVWLRLSWRGMTSNRARFAIGTTGGKLSGDAAPMPISTVQTRTSNFIVGNTGDSRRMLQQATFGASATLEKRVNQIGIRRWLDRELQKTAFTYPYPTNLFMPANTTTECANNVPVNCIRDNYTLYDFQNWFFKEALYGDAQLRQRVSWALSQIWVVSGTEYSVRRTPTFVEYYKVLERNSFGNYRDLMREMTFNPAMGDYLDMMGSTRTNPNENYAREILQLFTIGLDMLNQNGTPILDANGKRIPTYDQETVNNFTKVMTGWRRAADLRSDPNDPNSILVPNYRDPMILVQGNHDTTAKTLLNYTGAVNTNIPAGMNGAPELELALDNIFNHPNVAPFVSKALIQQLVTSDPTPAYVGRVAKAFNNNGSGVRGDMKAVIRAILLDPEARGSVKTEPSYGKLREPVLFATNILKNFDVKGVDRTLPSDGYISPQLSNMGQNPFQAPTVFNYYPPDYVIPGTTFLAPEVGILNTTTSFSRINFVNTMVYGRISVSANSPNGTSISLAEPQTWAQNDSTGAALVEGLNQKLLQGQMSNDMRNSILTAVRAIAATSPAARAQQATYLVLTSSQYQVQR